ncbi:hypothetical protein MFM001_18220 [Mycobacterium sp. MFM001]|uniref:alpha/beta fold hydrolase n=1 Tax=Mycobacterium sp. MFM001 TaxID=2049453 RepID=UPI000DA464B3|nr:hypothetical protein [Mycobacterium sp. MFM001]GBE65360.1 hypothetical protein MFM001_18220 [Mycobacterium sp. MFM001]
MTVTDELFRFRPQQRERLESTYPNHKTVIVEGAGLYTESEAPEEFVAAIRDWHPKPPAGKPARDKLMEA